MKLETTIDQNYWGWGASTRYHLTDKHQLWVCTLRCAGKLHSGCSVASLSGSTWTLRGQRWSCELLNEDRSATEKSVREQHERALPLAEALLGEALTWALNEEAKPASAPVTVAA